MNKRKININQQYKQNADAREEFQILSNMNNKKNKQ